MNTCTYKYKGKTKKVTYDYTPSGCLILDGVFLSEELSVIKKQIAQDRSEMETIVKNLSKKILKTVKTDEKEIFYFFLNFLLTSE